MTSKNIRISSIVKSGFWLRVTIPIFMTFALSIGAFAYKTLTITLRETAEELTGYSSTNPANPPGDTPWFALYTPDQAISYYFIDYVFSILPFDPPQRLLDLRNGDTSALDPGSWDTNYLINVGIDDFTNTDDPFLENDQDLINEAIGDYPLSNNPTSCISTNPITGIVLRIVDGDTIIVNIQGNEYSVRYIGINTPELVKEGVPVEFFAPEAKEMNELLVPIGSTVFLYKDISDTDEYGRLLRYVQTNGGVFVNFELLVKGYANTMFISPDISCKNEFLGAEQFASDNNLGLWVLNNE